MTLEETVTLNGGYVVPVEVLRLGWSLEERGCSLSVDGTSIVVTSPTSLSKDEKEALRRHGPALRQLLLYVETVG